MSPLFGHWRREIKLPTICVSAFFFFATAVTIFIELGNNDDTTRFSSRNCIRQYRKLACFVGRCYAPGAEDAIQGQGLDGEQRISTNYNYVQPGLTLPCTLTGRP